jgi:hypothetical protein
MPYIWASNEVLSLVVILFFTIFRSASEQLHQPWESFSLTLCVFKGELISTMVYPLLAYPRYDLGAFVVPTVWFFLFSIQRTHQGTLVLHRFCSTVEGGSASINWPVDVGITLWVTHIMLPLTAQPGAREDHPPTKVGRYVGSEGRYLTNKARRWRTRKV